MNGRGLPALGPRGEGWVALQTILFVAIVGCGYVGVYWPSPAESYLAVLGIIAAVGGAVLLLLGALTLGRGFTPQDAINFNGAPARTTFESPNALSFYVPALEANRNYQVTLNSAAGNSPVGTFRIDPSSVSVSPQSLNANRPPMLIARGGG